MTVRIISRLLIFFFLSSSSSQVVLGQTEKKAKTNEVFLRESIQQVLKQAFTDFPKGRPQLVFIRPESENPANWLLEEELSSHLSAEGFSVALPRQEIKSVGFEDCWDLFYRIIELRLEYPRVKSKKLFGKKWVTRQTDLNLSFRLTEKSTAKILWTKRKNHTRSDLIPKKMLPGIRSKQYTFLSPELPETATSKYLEPALVTAVVGGLVYLFFASR